MNLEKQLCSLELAKRLKELGVKQESYFEYRLFNVGGEMTWSLPIPVGRIPEKLGLADVGFGNIAAFTVAELWEIVKPHTRKLENMPELDDILNVPEEQFFSRLLDVNFIARCLIYLLENKLITV